MLKVTKFGGSSLASAEQMEKVGAIIHSDADRRFIIPSAPGKRYSDDTKVTDMLYRCYDKASEGKDISEDIRRIADRYQEIIDGLGLKLSLEEEFAVIEDYFRRRAGRDYAASRGEYLNGIVLANYLGCRFIDAKEVILFDAHGNFDAGLTNDVCRERLRNVGTAVIPGFYGAMPDGSIKTFSRGGSDITGSIISRAVRANVYENWTDVSGCLACDPRIVENPEVIETVTYRELRELSYMGASVLHEDAIFPVRAEGIPINIRNTNRPEDHGTLIVESTVRSPRHVITGIAGRTGFCSVTIDKAMMNSEVGFGRRVLQVFEENEISFEHTPSGIDTFSVLVHQEEFANKEQDVIAGLHRAVNPDNIFLESNLALVAIVGRGMKNARGTAGRLCTALADAGINIKMIDQGSSELNIIVGIQNEDFGRAIRTIYHEFIEKEQ